MINFYAPTHTKDIVENYFSFYLEKGMQKEILLASGYSFIFACSRPGRFMYEGKNIDIKDTGVLLTVKSYMLYELPPKTSVIGVRLRPALTAKFLNIDLQKDARRYIPLDVNKLYPPPCLQSRSVDENFREFEEFIGRFLASKVIITDLLDDIILFIRKKNGLLLVQELCDKYQISRRYLEKQFARHIGMSPGYYIRMLRFTYTLSEMERNVHKISELIAHYNYYDFSHFNRDFRHFTGCKPAEFSHAQFPLLREYLPHYL